MTVTPTVKAAAVLLAESVRVLVPEPETLGGLKDALMPVGRPGTDKLTALAKPLMAAIEIVLVPLAPCAIVTLPGRAEMLKSGFATVAAFTGRLNDAV